VEQDKQGETIMKNSNEAYISKIEKMEAEMAEKKANTPDPFAIKPTAKSPISFKGNFADKPISIGRRR
jgi:hypothetical protein